MSRSRNTPAPSDVAIVGIASCYSQARNTEQFWSNIINKVDAITEVPKERIDPDAFYDPTPGKEDKIYCKKGGWLGSSYAFNPLKYGTMPRTIEGAEPDQFLVLRTVHEALEDSGYIDKGVDGKRVSIILGRGNYLGAGLSALLQRGLITQQTLEIIKSLHPEFSEEQLNDLKTDLRRSLPEFGPEAAPGLIPNVTTGRVANRLNFMGKNFTVDAACASSLIATELGIQGLIYGQDDMVLVGGVHVFTNVPFLQVFTAMRALSPTSTIRPFDADCDGTIPGEGVGILVLKRLEDAEEAGDRIYAVIKGVGSSSDGKAKSVTAPRVEGEELAVQRAYEISGIPCETIELIEAHGTGTPVGDAAEIETMHRIFGPKTAGHPTVAVGSIKSMIGHAMPAAGAAGIIKSALALYHRVLPPTLNCRKPSPELVNANSRFYVNTELRPWIHSPMAGPRRAGINAFGFGGVNAHLILEEYKGGDPGKWRTLIRKWETELVVVGAQTRDKLHMAVSRLRQYCSDAPRTELRDIAYTQSTTLQNAEFRVSIVASSVDDLRHKLQRVEQRLSDPSCKQIKDSQGIYYFQDSPLRHGKVALLFPGEGSQYLNMMSDLCMHFPEVRECFDLADEMVEDQKDRYAPSADIFPVPSFSKEEEKAAEQRLWQMQRATEAVLTADGAAFTLLKNLGLKADMMAGHSAGEWIAMAASGILEVGEFLGSFSRLDHMYRRLAEDSSIPRMMMLAIGAGGERVAKILGEIDCTVHIANDNCPNQVVIVVELKDGERVIEEIRRRGIFVEKLAYDRGYHTSAFTYICDPLRKYFSEMAIRAPHTPVYCCTTAEPYPHEPKQILDHVAQTFARPLIFRQTIEAMYKDGARIFVEAGPRGNLTAFVDDILRGRPHLAVAVDQYRRPAITTLNNTLGLLTALHHPLDLSSLYVRRAPRLLTWDPAKDRVEDPDHAPGTMQVPLGAPRLESPKRPAMPVAASEGLRSPQIQEPELEPVLSSVEPQVFQGAGSPDVLSTHFELMESFLETQEEVMKAFLASGGVASVEVLDPQLDSISDPLLAPAAVQLFKGDNGIVPLEKGDGREAAGGQQAVNLTLAPLQPAADVTETLLQIVSDRTGYPIEMLGLDLDMEADLGIDSIKRVEVLSALQQLGGSQQTLGENAMEEVARLKTLRQVLAFLDGAVSIRPAHGGHQLGLRATALALRQPPLQRTFTANGKIASEVPGEQVTIVCDIDPNEHLYLADHSFDPVASEWDFDRNSLYFVPMTVSLAMMAEVAALLSPEMKVVGAKNLQASKWIEVNKDGPPVTIAITAKRVDERKASVRIYSHRADRPNGIGEILAEASIIFALDYPSAPNGEPLPLTNARQPHCTGPELYTKRRMFHGPSFQGIVALDAMADNGLMAKLDTLPSDNLFRSNHNPAFHLDPFILDAAGQLVGYWPIEYCTEGFVLFPIRIEELILYSAPLAARQRSVCQMRLSNISQRQLKADLDVTGPSGKLWMRVVGWEDWRFYWPKEFYEFWRYPNKGQNGWPVDIRPVGGSPHIVCRRVQPFGEIEKNMWENLWVHIILSRRELIEYSSITDKRNRLRWVCEKAVVKDAVRAWIHAEYGRDLYPADIEVNVTGGAAEVTGPWLKDVKEPLQVSVGSDGPVSVAAVGSCRLGMEIESIIHWETGFDGSRLQQRDRELVAADKTLERDEWLTRVWCAKKAAAKTMGIAFGDVKEVNRLVGETVKADSGEITFTFETSTTKNRLAVSTARDGDYIIALAHRGGS